jgi:hypothetical protein
MNQTNDSLAPTANPATTTATETTSVKDDHHVQTGLDISAFVGTYTNPGYGSFTLYDTRDWPPTSPGAQVLSEFRTVNDTRPDTLYAHWPRVNGTHFRLARVPPTYAAKWGNNTFTVRETSFFPRGFGKNTAAFETDDLSDYENGIEVGYTRMEAMLEEVDGKVEVKGLGWLGIIGYGLVSERERQGKTIEERADVWFTKVDSAEI